MKGLKILLMVVALGASSSAMAFGFATASNHSGPLYQWAMTVHQQAHQAAQTSYQNFHQTIGGAQQQFHQTVGGIHQQVGGVVNNALQRIYQVKQGLLCRANLCGNHAGTTQ